MTENPLKTYRIQHDMTQEALGEALGVSGQTIWRWENGNRKIARSLLPKVVQLTRIPARELRPDLAELMG